MVTPAKWKFGSAVFPFNNQSDEELKKNFKGFRKIREYYKTVEQPDLPNYEQQDLPN